MAPNPFTPTFGKNPPKLVGRDHELEEFRDALEQGPGAMARASLITGARGIGKTVMLNEFERAARDVGWTVVNATASDELASSLADVDLPRALEKLAGPGVRRTPTGGNATAFGFGGGVQSTATFERVPQWDIRRYLTEITDRAGLLLTVDEIHAAPSADLRQIATAVQHCIREGRDIAFVAAGLPHAVSDLLDDDVLTFLRRARRFDLNAHRRDVPPRRLTDPRCHVRRGPSCCWPERC